MAGIVTPAGPLQCFGMSDEAFFRELTGELEARGRLALATVVETYRAHGLFKRWPIDYLPTHGDVGAIENVSLALKALRRFAGLLWRHRRVVLHVHSGFDAGFWRDAAFMALASAFSKPGMSSSRIRLPLGSCHCSEGAP